MVPYLPLYLKSMHLHAWHIGLLTAVMAGTKIIAPNIWGWLADRSGRRMLVIRAGCLFAVLPVLYLALLDFGVMSLAGIIFLYSFFWNAVLAQFEAVTLAHLDKKTERYSRIRLWGSIGFIVAVASLGWVFDRISIEFFPVVVTLALLAIFVSSCLVNEPVLDPVQKGNPVDRTSFWLQLRKTPILVFFLVCFLMVFSHGAYYTFFSVLMEQYQHSRTVIGLLWGLGVAAEVVLFWYMPRLLPVTGVRYLLLLCLSLTVVRWLFLAFFPQSMGTMLFAQCLHAFSFAGFHTGAIETERRLFPVYQSGKAQAFYSAVGYGGGNALGALSSGAVWHFGSFWPFFVSALACMLAVFLVWRYLPEHFFAG